MDNRIAPIEHLIKQGLVINFRRVFNAELIVTNRSNKKELAQRRGQGQSLPYPLVFAELSSLGLPTTPSYKSTTLLRRGVVGQATSDNLGTFKVPLIPVESTYQILYVTNSFQEAEKFGKLWLMSAAAGFLKFDVTYGVANFGISLELDRSVAFPQQDASPQNIEEYEVSVNMVVHGFMSHDKLLAEQAANAIEVEGIVTADMEAKKALQQEDSPGDVQVFTFKREWPSGNGPLTQ